MTILQQINCRRYKLLGGVHRNLSLKDFGFSKKPFHAIWSDSERINAKCHFMIFVDGVDANDHIVMDMEQNK